MQGFFRRAPFAHVCPNRRKGKPTDQARMLESELAAMPNGKASLRLQGRGVLQDGKLQLVVAYL